MPTENLTAMRLQQLAGPKAGPGEICIVASWCFFGGVTTNFAAGSACRAHEKAPLSGNEARLPREQNCLPCVGILRTVYKCRYPTPRLCGKAGANKRQCENGIPAAVSSVTQSSQGCPDQM
jgi:hypothetical protein